MRTTTLTIAVFAFAVVATTAPAEAHCTWWHPGHCVQKVVQETAKQTETMLSAKTRLLYDAIRTLLDAELTAAEVAGLTVQDFDADTGAITVKNQVIYLPNDRLRAHPPFRSRYVRSRRR